MRQALRRPDAAAAAHEHPLERAPLRLPSARLRQAPLPSLPLPSRLAPACSPGCRKAFKVNKHLEYHLRLHDKPDSFACDIDGCEKHFATPSSLRMHRLLEHGRPGDESPAEQQLRAANQTVADTLDKSRTQLAEATS